MSWKSAVALLVASGLTVPALALARSPATPALERGRSALVVTDPQNDFLDPAGKAYGLFADNLRALDTVENLERLFRAARKGGTPVFVSPHFYFPYDGEWKHPGALQKQLWDLGIFRRADPVDSRGLEGSGADFLARYKPFILDGRTVVTSPHKVYGPESNDLLLQLRSRGIDTVVLAGLAANLCVDSHLRALVENGFRVLVVKDAVGAPGAEAYQAALVNYGLIANAVLTTEEAVQLLAR